MGSVPVSAVYGRFGDLSLVLPACSELADALSMVLPFDECRRNAAGTTWIVSWRYSASAMALVRRHLPNIEVTGDANPALTELHLLPLAARLSRQMRRPVPPARAHEERAPVQPMVRPQPSRARQSTPAGQRFDLRRKGA